MTVRANASWRRPARSFAGTVLLVGYIATTAFVFAFPVTAACSNASIAIDLSGYEGHWQRIEDNNDTQARLSAIGRALEGLSWIMRQFASPILKKSTAPPTEMDFAWDGQRLYQGVEGKNGQFSRAIDLDGDLVVAQDSRGVDFSSAWTWTGSGLNLRWEQHQAIGHNVYRIDSRDDTLIIEHTIIVTAISNVKPIVFRSRFSRIGQESLPATADLRLDPSSESAADRP